MGRLIKVSDCFVKPDFTAALLTGGNSRRMGRDKAFLPVEWEGVTAPLWARQLAILQSLGPEKLMISGPRKPGFPESVPVVPDEWKHAGPLGGIATCLKQIESEVLLVLAIDMPHVQPEFLKKLLARSEAGCGVVPVCCNRFEPLVAVYPRVALEIAVDQLKNDDHILQRFVEKLLKRRLLIDYEVGTGEQDQLVNWNSPEDVR
jgi:molybdenum cofactor guanylyltransferase